MSDSFNTTPSNWQGVDDAPTAGSDNLVKSDAVFKDESILNGKELTLEGTGSDVVYFYSVFEGIEYTITNNSANNVRLFGRVDIDSSNVLIGTIPANNSYKITPLSSFKYLCCTIASGSSMTISTVGFNSVKKRIFEDVSLIQGETDFYGAVIEKSNRLTTGVLKNNERGITVYVNNGYDVLAMAGDAINSLTTDLGQIISNGGFYTFTTDKKYIAINVRNLTQIPITLNDNVGFFIGCGKNENREIDAIIKNNNLINKVNYAASVTPTLIQGLFLNNGTIQNRNDRVTTGAIKVTSKIRFRLNEGYSVVVIGGDSPYHFTYDSGWLGKDNKGYYVVPFDNNFIALNIKNNTSDISPTDNIGLYIYYDDTALGVTNDNLENLSLESGRLLPVTKYYYTAANKTLVAHDSRATTSVVDVRGFDYLLVEKYYNATLFAWNDLSTSPIADTGWIIDGTQLFDISAYNYIAVNIKPGDGKMYDSYDINVKVFRTYANIDNANTKDKFNVFESQFIEYMFMNGQIVSPQKNTYTIVGGVDFKNNGDVCCGVLASDTSYVEDNASSYAELVMFNMLNPSETKKDVVVLKNGDIFEQLSVSFAYDTIAKFIDDSTVRVMTFVNSNTLVTRDYNLSNEELASTINICKLKVGNTILDITNSNVTTLRELTDCELPSETYGGLLANCNPVKVESYWWNVISLGRGSHVLCKSDDLITWEFVSDIPLNQVSEEVQLCYYDGKLYCASRGNMLVDNKFGKIGYYTIESGTWSNFTVLTNCTSERPALIEKDGLIYYIGQKLMPIRCRVDGKVISRNWKSLQVFDASLNKINEHQMAFQRDMVYPQLAKFGGNIYCFGNTDLRGFAFNLNGDGRNGLMFSYVDNRFF